MLKRKVFVIVLVTLLISAFIGGCVSILKNDDSTMAEEQKEENYTPTSTMNEMCTEHKEASLFYDLFIPASQGEIGANIESFIEIATVYGFNCIEEAGVLLVQEPNDSGCFLRCELLQYDDKQIQVNKLIYSRSFGNVQRQVTAVGIDAGQTLYYIGTTEFDEGTMVSSLKEVEEYLNGEISPEETATGLPETALGLFENILVPLAEGTLPNQAGAFKKVLEQYGYIYMDGEGLFTVYDPEHPDNYLFGSNSLLQDTDTISTLGFSMETETGSKRVEVYFFTEEPQFYVYNADFCQVGVEDFAQIKEYIRQK